MNTQTLTQRRALRAYTEAHRDAIYHAERQVDAKREDVPPPVSPWIYWPVVVGCSLVLTFAVYELVKLLPVIWRMS